MEKKRPRKAKLLMLLPIIMINRKEAKPSIPMFRALITNFLHSLKHLMRPGLSVMELAIPVFRNHTTRKSTKFYLDSVKIPCGLTARNQTRAGSGSGLTAVPCSDTRIGRQTTP